MDKEAERFLMISRQAILMMKLILHLLIIVPVIFLHVTKAASPDKNMPLVHMGVIPLTNQPTADMFSQRFSAQGPPLFYVSDINKGVSQGDIIRFRNKAVLIDGNVWQTMQNTGVLSYLRDIPVITLNARAHSEIWDARSKQVLEDLEAKGYTLGKEMLKIFENYFGTAPSDMELVIKFSDRQMKLIAPKLLINELKYTNVTKKVKSDDTLFFVSKLQELVFKDHPFEFKVWAVDPSEPSGLLSYKLNSPLPSGLTWDQAHHSLSGTPDTEGNWLLEFSVQNSSNKTAVMNCSLYVKTNTAPRITMKIDEDLVSETTYHFYPFISDAEHTLDQLKISIVDIPDGMSFNQDKKEIVWKTPSVEKDTIIDFIIEVKDPLDAVSQEKIYSCIVRSDNLTVKVTADLKLPVDTLVQGQKYIWPEEMFTGSGFQGKKLELVNVKGDNLTRFSENENYDGKCLIICPLNSGIHKLTFTFVCDTLTVDITKNLFVKEKTPPVFVSSLTSNSFQLNQKAFYTPVVFDNGNDSLNIIITDANKNKTVIMNGTPFQLPADSCGLFTFLFTASDSFGNTAQQHIYYSVEANKNKYCLYLKHPHKKSIDIGLKTRGFRVGFYSADFFKTIKSGFLGINTFQSPFLYIGANLFGHKLDQADNHFFVDLGLSARIYDEKLIGGGILMQMQVDYRKDSGSPWKFEGLFNLVIKQAFLVTDTTGYAKKILESDPEPYIKKLFAILNAYTQNDNVGFVLLLRTLYQFPAGFHIGPSIYMQENLYKKPKNKEVELPELNESKATGNFIIQRTGLCISHDLYLKRIKFSQYLDIGWISNSWKPIIKWNSSILFNS